MLSQVDNAVTLAQAHRVHRRLDEDELLAIDLDVEFGELVDQHLHAEAPLIEAVDVVVRVVKEASRDGRTYGLRRLITEIDAVLMGMHRGAA